MKSYSSSEITSSGIVPNPKQMSHPFPLCSVTAFTLYCVSLPLEAEGAQGRTWFTASKPQPRPSTAPCPSFKHSPKTAANVGVVHNSNRQALCPVCTLVSDRQPVWRQRVRAGAVCMRACRRGSGSRGGGGGEGAHASLRLSAGREGKAQGGVPVAWHLGSGPPLGGALWVEPLFLFPAQHCSRV